MPDNTTQNEPPRRHRKRWLLVASASIFLLLFFAVLVMPSLVNTSRGKSFVLDMINSSIAGKVELDRLRLGWFTGQSVSGLTLRDSRGDIVISNARLNAPDLQLLSALFGSRNYGQIEASVDEIHIRQVKNDPTNLEEIVSEPTGGRVRGGSVGAAMALPTDMNLNLDFTADRIIYESPGMDRIENENVKAGLQMSKLAKINLSLESDLTRAGKKSRMLADIEIENAFDDSGNPQLGKANVKADVKLPELPVDAIDQLTGGRGRLAAIIGPVLAVNINAGGSVDNMTVTIKAGSDRLNADINLENDRGTLRFGKNAKVNLELTPDAYATLVGRNQDGTAMTRLEQPVTFNLHIADAAIGQDGDKFDPANSAIDAELTISDIKLVSSDQQSYAVRNAILSIDKQRGRDLFTGNLQAVAEVNDTSRQVKLNVAAENILGGGRETYSLDAAELPVVFADVIAGTGGRIAELIGESLNARVDIHPASDNGYAFTSSVNTDVLDSRLSGRYGPEELLVLDDGGKVDLSVSPAAFIAWAGSTDQQTGRMNPPAMTLQKNMAVHVGIDQFELALQQSPGSVGIDPKRTRVAMSVEVPEAVFIEKETDRKVIVDQAALSIDATDLRRFINLLAEVKVRSGEDVPGRKSSQQPGQLVLKARAEQFVNEQGVVQPDRMSVSADGDIRHMPGSLIDATLKQDGILAAVLGDQAGGSIKLDYQPGRESDVDIDLKSDNVTSRISASVSPEGILSLRENAVLTLSVTPRMSQSLLGHIHPVFADAVASQTPATMTLYKDDFRMPVKNFKIQQLTAAGLIDPGLLSMKRSGWLDEGIDGIMNDIFLKSGGRVAAADQAEKKIYLTQFTPVSFTVRRGIVETSELWATSEDLAVGFQGSVNLKNNRIRKMTMGLLEVSLAIRNPRLAPFVKPAHIADLPITGSINEPGIDYGTFVSDIAGALASNVIRKQTGEYGGLIGGIVDVIGDSIKEERRKQSDLSWNPPPEAGALVENYYRQLDEAAKKQQQSPSKEPQSKQNQSPESPQKQPVTIFDLIDQLQDR